MVALQSAEIKRKTMEAAICVGEYLIPHARVAYAEMGADGVIQDTRYILRWIKEKLHKSFTKRDALPGDERAIQAGGNDGTASRAPADGARIYKRNGQLPHCPGPGRKPSPIFDVNPSVFQGPIVEKAEVIGMSVAKRSARQFPTRFPSAYASNQTGVSGGT